MAAKITFLVVISSLLAVHYCEAISCEEYVQTEQIEMYHYLANVSFPAPKPFKGIWELDMKTDLPFVSLGGFGATVESNGVNRTATFRSKTSVDLKSGEPVSFRFRINWGLNSSIPKVQELVWEDEEICGSSAGKNKIQMFAYSLTCLLVVLIST